MDPEDSVSEDDCGPDCEICNELLRWDPYEEYPPEPEEPPQW
jgi:hypothetical protein